MPELKEKGDFLVKKPHEDVRQAWAEFNSRYALTKEQADRFERYFDLLMFYNKQVNLTAIVSARGVIKHHFTDSLMISEWFDVSTVKGIVDVGTGAGFPALPLKIMYPSLPMILIEPNGKKRKFLELVAEELGLEDVQTCPLDWRTFIRTTESELDLFVSRAALPVEELCRMFKPSCSYNTGTLVYWASELWKPEDGVEQYIQSDHAYKVGSRKRRLIFLKRPVE
ncbi:MAG: rRNA (guanine527-N7)-methyltransferase [Candidatus Dependentiae bacterium]|nr:rRNA (guanine527-N7)-methyltransferase [Candidatus Dependentiae bacterium]